MRFRGTIISPEQIAKSHGPCLHLALARIGFPPLIDFENKKAPIRGPFASGKIKVDTHKKGECLLLSYLLKSEWR